MIFSSDPASPVDFGQVSLTRTRKRMIDILITTGVGEGGTYQVEVVSSSAEFAAEEVGGHPGTQSMDIVFPDAAAVPAIPAKIAFVAPAIADTPSATLTINVRNAANAIVDSGTITVTGQSIATAVVMVLDRSGSMSTLVGSDTRANRLRAAASSCLTYMADHEKLGVVTFDHIVTDVLPLQSLDTPGHEAAATSLFAFPPAMVDPALNPAGLTSIGGGILNAQAMISGEVDQNILVLTDGHHNYPPAIPAIASEDIYAIGLGDAAAVSTTALTQLTAGTGNYFLITGDISAQQLALDKYFLAVLTDVKNNETIVDPDGTLLPGQKHEIPFQITEAEEGFDAILLSTNPGLIDFDLIQPNKKVLEASDVNQIAGGSFRQGPRVSMFRFEKPTLVGEWKARLRMDKKLFALARNRKAGPVSYSFLVVANSSLAFDVQAHAKGIHVGSDFLLSGAVTELGRPTKAKVFVNVTLPDRGVVKVDLKENNSGRFSAVVPSFAPGLYQLHFFATGKSASGKPFTREARRSLHLAPAGFVPTDMGPIPPGEIPPGGIPPFPGGANPGGGSQPGGGSGGSPGPKGSLDELFERFPDLKKLLDRCCGHHHHGHGHGHCDCCCRHR